MDVCSCRQCLRDRDEHVSWEGMKFPIEATQMVTCSLCGNKRCPHATDHRLVCTRSNDPGQDGSSYGPVLRSQQVVNMTMWRRGDRVRKRDGAYAGTWWWICGYVANRKEQPRVIAEAEAIPGLLHIFNENQFEKEAL